MSCILTTKNTEIFPYDVSRWRKKFLQIDLKTLKMNVSAKIYLIRQTRPSVQKAAHSGNYYSFTVQHKFFNLFKNKYISCSTLKTSLGACYVGKYETKIALT